MDTFSLTVNLANDAFYRGDAEDELQRIVYKAVVRAMSAPCGPNGATGTVLDSNGNSVGKWTVA